MLTSEILNQSVQINDGLRQTSGDGVNMVFDKKYGIMFCVYMPGHQGSYGESRGRIALTYFPASQPTNTKTVYVSEDKDVYLPNILSLGDGRVRLFYEKDSRAAGDHLTCFKDFDFLTEEMTEERPVMLRREDGSTAPLCQSEQYRYLEARGYMRHEHLQTEQGTLGGILPFVYGGIVYGATSSLLSETVLYRSDDQMATVSFFAVCPYPAQYEFDYKIIDGSIHAIFRTDRELGSVCYTRSDDFGKTWSEPETFENSIQCRPRLILHNGGFLLSYNYYNGDTKNRPAIQQGRTSVRIHWRQADGSGDTIAVDLYSKCGIVNVCLADILGDAYLAYSTSELALEYQNGNEAVRGKDAIRYIKLGDLSSCTL